MASALDHRMTGLLFSRVLDGSIELPSRLTAELPRYDPLTRAHSNGSGRRFPP